MRFLLVALAGAAVLKVWYQDTVFRAAADSAVSAAYRLEAAAACQRHPANAQLPVAIDWSGGTQMRFAVGNQAIPVRFWQVDHALWNARYRHPNLVLVPQRGDGRYQCSYDLTLRQAVVSPA